MINPPVDINQIKHSAANGHFRSIALWLNYPLVPQAIYAQVKTDCYPGYLQVLLEFERPPKKDALIRLVCNRICRLESDVIRGVFLIGRLIGTKQPLWQQRVRLTQRQRSATTPPLGLDNLTPASDIAESNATPTATEPNAEPDNNTAVSTAKPLTPTPTTAAKSKSPQPKPITAATYGSKTFKQVPSYLIPREPNHQEHRRRPNRNVAPFPVVQIRPADIDSSKPPSQRRIQRRRLAPKEIIDQQFKYMRAIVVTGSAAAAFILGCVTETVRSQRGSMAHNGSPSLPTFNQEGWRPLSEIETQEIAYRSAMRSAAIPAALEPVAVMPHKPTSSPEDPTVTLVFGGDVAVGDVPLQTPDAVGQVLSDLDVFRDADVAMVGLGNSLASADTSLQENYLERTRPDAVDALRQGGIDIVGLTSDRTMEFGRQGLIETLDSLDSAGIYRVGAGRDYREARRPEVLEVKGQRIAYLSYSPDGETVATSNRAGLNNLEREGIIEDIAALREAVDWVVVNYRWYGDLETEPNDQQVNLSRTAIDAGADLVVGYHPQQLQGAELYKSRPIVYSLGDFIFQDAPLEDHDTATLRVSLRDKQMKVEFLPVSVREARPKAAAGETAQSILKQIRQASEALPSPLQFPAILEASSQKDTLLQPEKLAAPLKTLGELESTTTPSNHPGYWNENITPEADSLAPENTVPEEAISPDTAESSFDHEPPPNLTPGTADTFYPQTFDEPDSPDTTGSETTGAEIPAVNSPLESFNIQADELDVDVFESFETDELQESPPSTTSEVAPPLPDNAPKAFPESSTDSSSEQLPFVDTGEADTGLDSNSPKLTPEKNDQILLPSEHPSLEYDQLENWGEKSSPHKEFSPIEEHLDSLTPAPPLDSPVIAPAVSVEADTRHLDDDDVMDAISPHDEPLIGPLSQRPAESHSDELAS
ncbi:MAG: CapA family protein [Cyanobacteria bacterium P01_B01_bin.77]